MKNMGVLDRTVRIVIAVAILALFMMKKVDGATAIVLGIVAVVMLATSLVGWCPLYTLLRISSQPRPGASA